MKYLIVLMTLLTFGCQESNGRFEIDITCYSNDGTEIIKETIKARKVTYPNNSIVVYHNGGHRTFTGNCNSQVRRISNGN